MCLPFISSLLSDLRLSSDSSYWSDLSLLSETVESFN